MGQRSRQHQGSLRGLSVQTFFRFKVFDSRTRAMIQDTMRSLVPALQPRDGPKIALIRATDTAPKVLDLLPLASGAAEVIWDQQLSRFGNEALSLIMQRLEMMAAVTNQQIRSQPITTMHEPRCWLAHRNAQ